MGSTSAASRPRPGDERGFTLIEVVIAAFIAAVAVGGAIATLGAPQKQAYSAQRYAIAASLAEQDVNQLASRAWSDICTSGAITSMLTAGNQVVSGAPTNPWDFVGGASGSQRFLVLTNYKAIPSGSGGTFNPSSLIVTNTPANGEQLVTGSSGGGSPNCVPETATISAAGVSGTLYRFVTYANEVCTPSFGGAGGTLSKLLNQVLVNTGLTALLNQLTSFLNGGLNLLCTSPNNEKRITDAIVLSSTGNGSAPSLPIYLSTLVPNPKAGVFAGSSTGDGITASCTVTLVLVVNCSASANP